MTNKRGKENENNEKQMEKEKSEERKQERKEKRKVRKSAINKILIRRNQENGNWKGGFKF